MNWQAELADILSSYFSDWSIEEGVEQLVFVSADHPDYHDRFLSTLDAAIRAATRDDPAVLDIVRRDLYAENIADAREVLARIRAEYEVQYRAAATEG